jgi:hypothetical protein
MNHEQIDQFDLIDRYLMGKLPEEESNGFEKHFVDCPQCLARLKTTKCFLQDLRLVAAEQVSQIDHQPPRSRSWHFPQRLLHSPRAWAAACLLIAAVASAVFVVDYTRRLHTQVNQAESLSEQWQRRYEDERQAAISADSKHQETELQQAEKLRALEAKLKDEEAQRTKLAAALARGISVEGNVPIFFLHSVRGSEPETSESVNSITISRSSAMFFVSISLEEEGRFENYQITIFDDRERRIWKSPLLTPVQRDSLSISLRSSLFRPGHFSLIVEGIRKEGGKDPVGNYPFQIIKTL